MYVKKRNGIAEKATVEKIEARIANQCRDLKVDPTEIAQKVFEGLHDGATTAAVDELAAQTCADATTRHPDHATLAARIAISALHKNTEESFVNTMRRLHEAGKVAGETLEVVIGNAETLESAIVAERDFGFDYFGYKTLEKSYLLRIGDAVVERPQHMLMRVAVGIHGKAVDDAIETYDLMSRGKFVHATPTLFNAGTTRPQLSSCFLLSMVRDDADGLHDVLKRCALVSESAGGIGLSVHRVRARGRDSKGLVPVLRLFNNAVLQIAGKRPGSIAVYLEPWHADVFDFLDLRKNTGKEEMRARDLFLALWIPDLFMRRVQENGTWSLMCPSESPGLDDLWGVEFDALYERYEAEGRYRVRVPARKLWKAVMTSQVETGTPYLLYKDACNRKSNQRNLGTIKCSNLCTEIVEYTSEEEVAVCNLASVALSRFVEKEMSIFRFDKLRRVVEIITRNLNKIIDVNFYPVPEAERSNKRHRPIGIGVQGLADAFLLLRLPFDSETARKLNRYIFETVYYAALNASCELARTDGPYETYEGSPASEGVLQCDMWNGDAAVANSGFWDWKELREKIAKYGLRNSLLVAPMPTASTAQILGNNESTEPYTSNFYARGVSAGTFQVVNRHLFEDLEALGLWNEATRNRLMADNGSVQNLSGMPEDLKRLYRTVWEIPQKAILEMAAERGLFVDQSQSTNLHVAEPTYGKLTSMHFYGWKLGLKTGCYYLRTKGAANAIKFTVCESCVA